MSEVVLNNYYFKYSKSCLQQTRIYETLGCNELILNHQMYVLYVNLHGHSKHLNKKERY